MECEGNCLRWCDAVHFGKHVYVTAHSHPLSNKTTRRHMLQDSNLHSHCIILHYSQTPQNVSECAVKLKSTKT